MQLNQSDREFSQYITSPLSPNLQPIIGCQWRQIAVASGLSPADITNIAINSGLEIQSMLNLLFTRNSWAGMKAFASAMVTLKLSNGVNILLNTPYVSGFGI